MKAVEFIIWVPALGLPLLGGWFVLRFLIRLGQSRRSPSWPVVTGLVTGPAPGGKEGVSYRYEVDGKHYVSHRVYIGDGARGGAADLDDEVAAGHHAPTGQIDVYHDPDKPHLSVLEPGLHAAIFFNLFIGLIFAGIGIGLLEFLITQIMASPSY